MSDPAQTMSITEVERTLQIFLQGELERALRSIREGIAQGRDPLPLVEAMVRVIEMLSGYDPRSTVNARLTTLERNVTQLQIDLQKTQSTVSYSQLREKKS